MAQIADTITGVAGVGFGTYMGIAGLTLDSQYRNLEPAYLLSGAILVLIGICIPTITKIMNHQYKEEEIQEILTTGAARQPNFTPIRPLSLGVAALMTYPLLITGEDNSKVALALNLALVAGAFNWYSQIASNYFRSQIMTPPSTKKSIYKAVTEYVTKPFHKTTPQPVVGDLQLTQKK